RPRMAILVERRASSQGAVAPPGLRQALELSAAVVEFRSFAPILVELDGRALEHAAGVFLLRQQPALVVVLEERSVEHVFFRAVTPDQNPIGVPLRESAVLLSALVPHAGEPDLAVPPRVI